MSVEIGDPALFDRFDDGIRIVQDGRIVFVNTTLADVLGYARGALLARPAASIVAASDRDGERARLASVLEGQPPPDRYEISLVTRSNELVPVDVSASRVTFDGEPASLSIIRARPDRQERSRSEARLRALFDESPDVIVTHDLEGNITDVNQTACEELGYSREELLALTVADVETGVDPEQLGSQWTDMTPGETFEFEGEHRRKDGSTYPVELLVRKLEDGVTAEILAVGRNISERTRAEAKQQLLVTASHRVGASESFVAGLERTVQAICDYTDWEYGEIWLPDESDGALAYAGGWSNAAGLDPFLDGSATVTFDPDEGLPGRVYASGSPEWIADVAAASDETFKRGALAADVGLNAAYGVPLAAEDEVLGVLVFFMRQPREIDELLMTDVIDVVLALDGLIERRRQQLELREQRDNLELLNEIIRHDIRNDLTVIHGYAELVEEHVDREGREYLRTVAEKTEQAISLTNTARDLSAIILGDEHEPQPISVRTRLERQIDELRSGHPHASIALVDESDPVVVADEMIEYVFRNLLLNAIQHNDTSTPEVMIRVRESDETVRVEVADNGPGLPDDRKATIFGKGERGRRTGGTGIGLYLVRSLVDRYGGDVWVEDNEPNGAVFVVTLPTAAGSAQDQARG